MISCAIMGRLRGTVILTVAVLVLLLALLPQAQAPATPFTLITRDARRPLTATVVNNQELLALDDIATLFQLALREDAGAGSATLTYRGRTIVLAANQATVSVNGRAVSLPTPILQQGRRWLAPVEFLQSALAPIYDQRIQVRRAARLIILGDLRVPRVTARIDSPGPPTRVTFEVAPPTGITATQEGQRVVVRVDADALELALPVGGGGVVQQIRPGEQGNTVVLSLDGGVSSMRAVPASPNNNLARLIIDLQGGGAATPDSADASPAPRPAPPPAAPVDLTEILGPRKTGLIVVIDPGHGGADTGARGRGGATEKQIALDVARRLKALLEMRMSARVVLTRTDDTAVDFDTRAAVANQSRGDLFISLHLNAAPSPDVSGTEVYYLQSDRELELTRTEAAKTTVAVPVAGGGTRPIEVIPWDLAQARYIDSSGKLAAFFSESLAARMSGSTAPVRRVPLRMLKGVNMPAVLVEMAYLTNPAQEKAARSDDFKKAMVEALHDAVARFRSPGEEARIR
jgi:N-acetylmuramoyl-L-alanine amidase